jgi:hypothetical protein
MTTDPVAEAQKVLADQTLTAHADVIDALSGLLSYALTLLEPLGDEGRELVADARNTADIGVPDFTNSALLYQLAAFIEGQADALNKGVAAVQERIRHLKISEETSDHRWFNAGLSQAITAFNEAFPDQHLSPAAQPASAAQDGTEVDRG